MGMHLIQSSPNLYNNYISSEEVSVHCVGHCYPNLAPYVYDSQLNWSGGKNVLSSSNSDNIQLVSSGNVNIDFGENSFDLEDTANTAFHIYGRVDSSITKFYGRNNCWSPMDISRIYLRRNDTTTAIATETGGTLIDCQQETSVNDWTVVDLGNDVYDSLMLSDDNTGETISGDEILYNQGIQFLTASMYSDGISTYKDLIDNYPEFYNLPKSTINLYACYQGLDTGSYQSDRNTLFGNLKIYLEDRISSNDYRSEDFLEAAYDIILMCEVNMENMTMQVMDTSFWRCITLIPI